MGESFRTVNGIAEFLIDILGLKWRGLAGQDREDNFYLVIPRDRKITITEVFESLTDHYKQKGCKLIVNGTSGIDEVHCDFFVRQKKRLVRSLVITLINDNLAVAINQIVKSAEILVN